jgi:hypothetical protein
MKADVAKSGGLFAIESAICLHPHPGDANDESTKDHSGYQCLSQRVALPQIKQGGTGGDHAE